MVNALKFRQKVAQQPGEVARLKVVQGPDSGSVFVLTGRRATMGRGEENDIVLGDLRASRRHAEIGIDPRGAWLLKDLGSANGILLDGQVIREGAVKQGDRFVVGETTMEFQPAAGAVAVAARTAPVNPNPSLSPGGQPQQQYFNPALAGMGGAAPAAVNAGGIAGINGGGGRAQSLNPRLILYAAVIAGLFFLPGEEEPRPKKAKKGGAAERDLASYLPEYEAGKTGPAEMFYREGFREFREKNYLRAKTRFETVLQIAPGHRLATIYLQSCLKAIETEVDDHLVQGKKSVEIGKLKDARGHYEAVMRLLHRDVSHASFLEAREALIAVDKAMRGVAKE